MDILIYICIAFGVYLIYSSFFPADGKKKVSVLDSFDFKGRKGSVYTGWKFLDVLGRINAPIFKIEKLANHYKKIANRGGLELSPLGFFTLKEMAAVLVFLVSMLLNLEGKFIALAVLVGFFLPDLWVVQRTKRYQQKILRVLPESIDLLSLCVSAGLDFMGAIKWITESKVQFSTPFMDELVRVREEVRLGRSRAQALADLEERLNMPEVSALVRTLILSERLGVAISEALDNFSQENREIRFHRGERTARMAGIKVLFPLIFFILPVIGIIIIGPVILQFMQQGFMGM